MNERMSDRHEPTLNIYFRSDSHVRTLKGDIHMNQEEKENVENLDGQCGRRRRNIYTKWKMEPRKSLV
ncbi:hypothetical protein BLOT_006577 [Blomia tropicalis]|nr:hypothetical protein BLOT_006577 [Blomia tropicalis]